MESPSKLLLSLEGVRALCEYGMGLALNIPLHHVSPKGDGHPVLVLPGLGAADGSTHYLRNFLTDIGYRAEPWNLGRNMGPREGLDILLDKLLTRITDIYEAAEQEPVSIIGWSLGGIYGRELAKICPEIVRQVITLGTPFKGDVNGTNVRLLYEILSRDKSHKDPEMIKKIRIPPPVPFTSLYSKSDGVVHWECSIEEPGNKIENIEVAGASHLGLGHHPISMYVIANRLQQKKETWEPYKN
jgi:hypothetical protein